MKSPAIQASPADTAPGLTPEQIRRETALGLAGDLLDRALSMLPAELHITLIQIADSGLLVADPDLEKQVRDLSFAAERLQSRLHDTYPHCQHGAARHLLRKEDITLARMVDLFRQEQFWTRRGREGLIASEAIIADLYKLYSKVEFLRSQLDAEDMEGTDHNARHPAPKCEPNPYESLY